jgi:integrase
MQYENALALRTSLETGWRIDDVLHLREQDLQGRTLTLVRAMKTGKADKKVVSADLAKRLRQIAAHGRLFDGRFGNKPRTRQTVWRDVKKAAKQLELDGNIAPHSARKTYAVEDFHDNGLRKVQDDLQHDNINTTMIYAFADLIDATPAMNVRLTDGAERALFASEPEGDEASARLARDDARAVNQRELAAALCRAVTRTVEVFFSDKVIVDKSVQL